MAFLSGSFGPADDLPEFLQVLRRCPAAPLPARARARRLRRRGGGLGAPDRDRGPGRLGRRRLRGRASPLRLGAARALEDFQIGVLRLSMQDVAQIAFLDDDGDIRVNFGMFAGREATQAEIDDLAHDLLVEVSSITIVAEHRTVADRDMEASVHQIRIELERRGPAAAAADRRALGRGLRRRAARRDHRRVDAARPQLPCGNGLPLGSPQRRDRRARRPRQDDARRRDALAVGRLPREPGRGRARARLDRPRAREGDHDPRQEHGRPLRQHEDQHRRHAGPCRLRRRGRARPDDGRRRAPARRRERGAAAADPLRAAQGARGAAAGDPRRQQGRPARRADQGGRRRGVRALPRPRRRRGAGRVPDRLHERARGPRRRRAGGARRRPRPALRAPARAAFRRPSTTPSIRCRRS